MHILDSGSQAMNGADNGTSRSRAYPVQNDAPPPPPPPPPDNPSGVLRALVFYEDPDCLDILADMLEDCRYQVTRCSSFDNALRMLMQNRDGFDIFLSNAVVYGVDGFKLLGRVSKQMDIPVIVMSIEDCTPVTTRCIFHGFCDYLVADNKKEVLGDLWRHVRRRRECTSEDPAQTGNPRNGSVRRQEEKEATTRLLKKPRVAWDRPLHQRFVAAVNQLGGVNKAVPKRIWETMDIPWLTKDNVSSHLQKYRDQVLSEKKAKGSRGRPPVPKPVPSNVQEHPRNQVRDIDTRSWTRQHPMMNGDEWHRSPQAFPSTNIDVQMGPLHHHQPTEPVIDGNGGQLNFSDWRLAEISTPQPPPPPLDFSVSSYSAFWSEEPSIDYNVSEMGHQECELTGILEGFRPGSIIPRHPPGNAISGQSAIPDQEQREGTGIYKDKLGFDGRNSEDRVPN